jgi:hypothetical protein
MTQIILTDQQAAALLASDGQVRLCDADGKTVGLAQLVFTAAQLAEIRRRAREAGVWYTTEEVLAHLESLDPK